MGACHGSVAQMRRMAKVGPMAASTQLDLASLQLMVDEVAQLKMLSRYPKDSADEVSDLAFKFCRLGCDPIADVRISLSSQPPEDNSLDELLKQARAWLGTHSRQSQRARGSASRWGERRPLAGLATPG